MKHTLPFLLLSTFFGFLLLRAAPAVAQTEHLTRSQQRKEVRNSLKEAKQVTSDYSESHLDVDAYNFKNGASGRKLKKTKKKDAMPINEDGTAVVKQKFFLSKSEKARARKE